MGTDGERCGKRRRGKQEWSGNHPSRPGARGRSRNGKTQSGRATASAGGRTHSRLNRKPGASGQSPAAAETRLELFIDDLNLSGQGVARKGGMVYFVNGLLPGERALCRVVEQRRNYVVADWNSDLRQGGGIEQFSPDRIEPDCPLFPACGGCDLRHLSYSAELKWKQKQVADALTRIGGFSAAQVAELVAPVIGMANPDGYRNKMQFPVTAEGIGFYRAGSNQVVDGDNCLAGLPAADTVRTSFRHYMKEQGLLPYNPKSGQGQVRHLLVRVGERTGECMVCPVVTRPDLPGFSEWLGELATTLKAEGIRLASAFINVNKAKGNRILGEDFRHCYGAPVIYEEIAGIRYRISPVSFFQVNTRQAEVLFRMVAEFAAVCPTDTVFDLYGGTGSIALQLAGSCRQVVGNEIVEAAVEDAKRNALANGIENARFIAGKAEVVVPKLYQEGVRADVVVVDPPRKGCDRILLDTVVRMEPRRLVYVSCSPATLARDLKILMADGGFRLEGVQPVDMFPRTTHVETVVLMSRNG